MRAATYQQLIDDLEMTDAPDVYKQLFTEIIRRNAAQNGVAALERQERVRFAQNLLDRREGRPIISERLQRTYGISRTQAYEDISKALQVVRKSHQKPDGSGV